MKAIIRLKPGKDLSTMVVSEIENNDFLIGNSMPILVKLPNTKSKIILNWTPCPWFKGRESRSKKDQIPRQIETQNKKIKISPVNNAQF